MASHIHKRGPTTPEMNITPLIDVVFLLIIFFMLVNKIVSDENPEMKVPKLVNPKTYELGDTATIVVNIAPAMTATRNEDQRLDFDGEPSFVSIGSNQRFDIGDLEQITKALQDAKERNEDVEVLLRADAALFYDAVQPVMTAITAANISKINLVAHLPEQSSDQGP